MSNEEQKEIQSQILRQINAMVEEIPGDKGQQFLVYARKEAENNNLQTAINFMMEAERSNRLE